MAVDAAAGSAAAVGVVRLARVAGSGKRKEACPNNQYVPAGSRGCSSIHNAYLFTVAMFLIRIEHDDNYQYAQWHASISWRGHTK